MKSFSFKSFVKILFLSHFNFFRNVFTESFLLTPLRGNFFWALSSLRPCKIFVLVNSVIYFLMYVCLPKSSTPLLLTTAISNLKRILKRKKLWVKFKEEKMPFRFAQSYFIDSMNPPCIFNTLLLLLTKIILCSRLELKTRKFKMFFKTYQTLDVSFVSKKYGPPKMASLSPPDVVE